VETAEKLQAERPLEVGSRKRRPPMTTERYETFLPLMPWRLGGGKAVE